MTLAVQATPRHGMYKIAHRIAARFEPVVVRAFVDLIERIIGDIDLTELVTALETGNLDRVDTAAKVHLLAALLADDPSLESILRQVAQVSGSTTAEALTHAIDIGVAFDRFDPDVVLYARRQAAELVVGVPDDVREAIRVVIAVASAFGLTVQQQAIAIRQVVGLPPNWAAAPLNLANEIREGREAEATARRLSAIDKARIRSKIRRNAVTEEFVDEMQERYRKSLLNRRALNIAHDGTLAASNHGQRQSWRQAKAQGVLPNTVRRVPLVTADDRLRPTHAAVPGMNPDGVELDQPYNTPWGFLDGPPWEADPYGCRCGEGLIFPGRSGVL